VLIFLERQESSQFRLTPLSPAEVLHRLNEELMLKLPEATSRRDRTIKETAEVPSWLLRYGGDPHEVAQEISRHLAQMQPCAAGE
jgi:hypothetical protein